MHMALILGIDPGSRVTGFGVIKADGNRQEYVASGCIRTTAKETLAERLDVIFKGVTRIIGEYDAQELAIEKIFMSRSAESALKLGHARGVSIVAAVNRGLPVFEYEARKIKQAVVGSGGASKIQVQHMVMTLLKLSSRPQEDAADALAIAICHVNTQHNLSKIGNSRASGPSPNRFRRGRLIDEVTKIDR